MVKIPFEEGHLRRSAFAVDMNECGRDYGLPQSRVSLPGTNH